MAKSGYAVMVLFKDGTRQEDLRAIVNVLRQMELGSVWPLSARYLTLGALIDGVTKDKLREGLVALEKLEFVKLADQLIMIEPNRPEPGQGSCCKL